MTSDERTAMLARVREMLQEDNISWGTALANRRESADMVPALADEVERLAALCHEQRIALEKVKSFGSHSEDWDGVSVSYFVDEALKSGDQS